MKMDEIARRCTLWVDLHCVVLAFNYWCWPVKLELTNSIEQIIFASASGAEPEQVMINSCLVKGALQAQPFEQSVALAGLEVAFSHQGFSLRPSRVGSHDNSVFHL